MAKEIDMSDYYAVLLDTVSIQKYIFQSNKLKENLGASFLVEEIYKKYLQKSITKVLGNNFDFESWTKTPNKVQPKFDIGYIGGGNTILLFEDEHKAEEFIKEWTKLLIVNAPGITTAVALKKIDLNNKFSENKNDLFKLLGENKSKYIPQTNLLRHGITAECNRSGLSIDTWNKIVYSYISSSTNAKIESSILAKNEIHDVYKNELKNKYCFSEDIEKLGQIEGEDSHIAIVHIDGNNIGERFKKMNSLEDIRNLSLSVDKATKDAFKDLIEHVVKNYNEIMECLGFNDASLDEKHKFPRDDESGKKILPIRPIILGGDDITFVSDGKLGIYFAKLFIEFFEKKNVSDRKNLTACAGVSIIKTKYPFYRGYRLAEELCGNAKKVRKNNNDVSSLLDFHISTGGLAGCLAEIRGKYFNVPQGNLLFRPYKIINNFSDEQSFNLLIKNTGKLKKLPRNKIHELRKILTLSKEASNQFVEEVKFRGRALPGIPGKGYEISLFENGRTPYFDMIELMEFYPDFEFRINGGE